MDAQLELTVLKTRLMGVSVAIRYVGTDWLHNIKNATMQIPITTMNAIITAWAMTTGFAKRGTCPMSAYVVHYKNAKHTSTKMAILITRAYIMTPLA